MDVPVISGLKSYIEIPIALLIFSFQLQAPVFTNLIMFRTCYVTLGQNITECALLGTGSTDSNIEKLEALVEPHAAFIAMAQNLPASIISAILGLFLGTWSDKFGRKPILILTIAGYTVSMIITTILSTLNDTSPWYFIINTIPVILTGGLSAFLTVTLSYVADITNKSNRGLRMGIFEVTFASGVLLGTIMSSYVYKWVGYVGIFVVSTGCMGLALLFTIFILVESLQETQTEGMFRNIFETEHVKVMFNTAVRSRPNHLRTIILFCIAIVSIFLFASLSDGGIIFLFFRKKFNWTIKEYTRYSSVRDFLSIIGTFGGIYGLHKILKIEEMVLVLLGLLSVFNGAIIQGLATLDSTLYFGAALRCLGGVTSPMIRSFLSKITPHDEIGKIFAMMVMTENILALTGPPIYTEIYNKTINTNPGIFNFVTASVFLVAIILSILIIVMTKKSTEPKFVVIIDEVEEQNSIIED